VAYLLKGRILELAETVTPRERICKHIVPAAMKEHETMEKLLEAVFSVRSVPRLYNEIALGLQLILRRQSVS
jgi:hypothetical protein